MTASASRHVVIVAYPSVQLLDVAGPLEVFSIANRFDTDRYRLDVVTSTGAPFETSSGVTLVPHASLAERTAPVDTVIVAGGEGTPAAYGDDELVEWLREADRRSRRVTSVCSGAFLLGAAGLLEGRRATTHWSECERLARSFPTAIVDPDAIYVRDGHVATSAGITAGMDLALALLEEDGGRDLALEVARWLVLFVRRPGGQSQFSTQLRAQAAEREPLRELQSWIVEHPTADLAVATLADRVAMSPRHFARVFTKETGVTPAVYVEAVRVDLARRLLEDTGLGLDAVAVGAGFGSVETLRRAFHRTLAVAPSDYRERFRPSA